MQTTIIQDIPLKDIALDRFGREPIVDLIIGSINKVVSTNHPCLVYGIYGKWGEGKTSLMNFVKSKLVAQGKSDGINIVEFNPWLVNNDEAILREFFKSIMTDVDEVTKGFFNKYGSLAIFASKTIVNAFVPGVGNALADGIGMARDALADAEDTLAENKKKVSEAIIKSKRHLVVLIDDVDRLDKEELHTVLRLIRQVADFENCIYVVAMDVDMVAKSIAGYHGNGTVQDGRKFIDKIVQVPITLPQIPPCDMQKLVKEMLTETLQDAVEAKETDEIANAILPYIRTYRELKRYCNQLSFILPYMKGEVNIQDLCSLEAIKMTSEEIYARIYEREEALRHIVGPSSLNEDAAQNYEAAKEYVTEGVTGRLKDLVKFTVDSLFNSGSVHLQDNVDKKRLDSDVYFQKYFTHLVPSNLIPDRELDTFKKSFAVMTVEAITEQFDNWLEKYSASEVKRAALYVIRHCSYGDERCKASSVMAKTLSLCSLAKGLPPHVFVDPDTVPAFVAIQIIYSNMFVQDEKYAQINVWDADLLDETLGFIFEKSEMNYCMNLLCSCDGVLGAGVYNGRNVLPVLIKRFKELGIDGQLMYSKFMLVTLLRRWKRIDEEGFNAYAKDLFVNPEIPFSKVLNKFIDGTDDGQDMVDFVGLFKMQIPQINERLEGESGEVRESHAARVYSINYKPLLYE